MLKEEENQKLFTKEKSASDSRKLNLIIKKKHCNSLEI